VPPRQCMADDPIHHHLPTTSLSKQLTMEPGPPDESTRAIRRGPGTQELSPSGYGGASGTERRDHWTTARTTTLGTPNQGTTTAGTTNQGTRPGCKEVKTTTPALLPLRANACSTDTARAMGRGDEGRDNNKVRRGMTCTERQGRGDGMERGAGNDGDGERLPSG
jgi:hypothetical protein